MKYLGIFSVFIGIISAIFIFFSPLRLASLIISIIALIIGGISTYYKYKKNITKIIDMTGTILSGIVVISNIILLII